MRTSDGGSGSIAGIVVIVGRGGAEQATVWAAREAAAGARNTTVPSVKEAKTGPDGAFVFVGLQPGSYAVTAAAPKCNPATVRHVESGTRYVTLGLWPH